LSGKGLDYYHPPYPSHPLSYLPGGMSGASPSLRVGVMDVSSLHHGVYPGTLWSPTMSDLLDLRATSYYPPSMVQGLRGSVYGGTVPGSRLGPRKSSLQGKSLHLPTQDTQNRPDATTNSDPPIPTYETRTSEYAAAPHRIQFSSRHAFLPKPGGLDFGPRTYILATEPTLTYGSALASKLGGFDHAGGEREERETGSDRAKAPSEILHRK